MVSAHFPAQNPDFLTFSPERGALVIFCRAPRLGQVKTRLAATRGDEFALGLYRAMLLDTLTLGQALSPHVDTWAYFTPEDAFHLPGENEAFGNQEHKNSELETALHSYWKGLRFAQCPGDLRTKMGHAFATLRGQGYQNIVLMGSDSPDLPLAYLQTGFTRLENHDVVIGPSEDGGFYLLGTSREFPLTLFEGITWSTNSVYRQLCHNIETHAQATGAPWRTAQLLPWRDVDEEADLLALRERLFKAPPSHRPSRTEAPHTREFLHGAAL